MLLTVRQLASVRTGLANPDDVVGCSVVEITQSKISFEERLNSVFDPRLGASTYGEKCGTCQSGMHECPGHFGHVHLTKPFYQPFFLKRVYDLVRKSCWNCHKPHYGNSVCPHCEDRQGKWSRDGLFKDTFSHRVRRQKIVLTVDDVHAVLQHHDRLNKPEQPSCWMLNTVLPVGPPSMRPSILNKGLWSHNSLTHTYCSVVKENHVLRSFLQQSQPPHIVQQQWRRTQDTIYKLYDVKASANDKQYVEGIRQRIDGKQGRFRKNLLGE